jgi:hypothetical protein
MRLRDHYNAVEKQGIKVPELHPEPPPPELWYLWHWYLDLTQAFPREIIPYTEIRAWQETTCHSLLPWESLLLRKIDVAAKRAMKN